MDTFKSLLPIGLAATGLGLAYVGMNQMKSSRQAHQKTGPFKSTDPVCRLQDLKTVAEDVLAYATINDSLHSALTLAINQAAALQILSFQKKTKTSDTARLIYLKHRINQMLRTLKSHYYRQAGERYREVDEVTGAFEKMFADLDHNVRMEVSSEITG